MNIQAHFNSEALALIPEITAIYSHEKTFILRFFCEYKKPFTSLNDEQQLNFKLELEQALAYRAQVAHA